MDREKRRCHRCGSSTPTDEASCAQCGAVLGAICTSTTCGATFPNDLAACPECGEHNEPHTYRSPLTARRVVLALVVLAALGAAGAWGYERHIAPRPWRDWARANQAFTAGRYDEAELRYARYAAEHGETADSLYFRALCLRELGRREEAEGLFARVVERDASNVDALNALANSSLERGDTAGALLHARRVLVSEPENPVAHVVIGSVLSTPGLLDAPRARWHLRRAMADAETSRIARVLLAELTLTMDWALAGGQRELEVTRALATAVDETRRRLRSDDEQHVPDRERIEMQMFLARCALASGDVEEAAARLSVVGREDPRRSGFRAMQGRVFWLRGLEAQAKAEFDAALEADPNPLDALRIASFYDEVDRPDLAAEVLRAARIRHPDDPALRIHEARTLVAEGRLVEAEAALREAQGLVPDEAQVEIWLADVVVRDPARRDEAEDILRATAERRPDDPMPQLRLADVLLDPRDDAPLAEGAVAEARAIVVAFTPVPGHPPPLVRDSPADVYAGYVRGKLMLVEREFTAAIEELGRIADRNPDDPYPHLLLARAHEERGEQVLAGLELTAAMRTGGETADLLVRRARTQLRRSGGSPDMAAADARSAIALQPDSVEARLALSRAWMFRTPPQTEFAERMLRTAIAEHGPAPELRLELARVLVVAGDHAAGDAEAVALLADDPPDAVAAPAVELRAAIADLRAGEHLSPAARVVLEEALRRHATSARWHTRFAGLMLRAGDLAAAERWALAALESEPTSVRAQRIRFECLIGDEARSAEAERIAASLADSAPDRVDALYVRGKLALRQGRPAEAIVILGDVVERAPLDEDASYFLAHALAESGDLRESRRELERMLHIRPGSVGARALLADVAFREGRRALRDDRLDEAFDALRSALGTDSAHVAARAAITISYLRAAADGDQLVLRRARKEAEQLVEELEARLGDGADGIARLGAGLALLGSVAEAQSDWAAVADLAERHAHLYPDDTTGLRRLAHARSAAGRNDDALRVLQKGCAAHPGDWPLVRALVSAHVGAGRDDVAIAAVTQWLAAHPRHAAASMVLGWLRIGKGDDAGAEAALRVALDEDPTLEGAQIALADVLLRRSGTEAALAFLDELAGANGQTPALTFLRGRITHVGAPDEGAGIATMTRAFAELGPDARPRRAVTLMSAASRHGTPDQVREAVRAFLQFARDVRVAPRGWPDHARMAEAYALAGAALHALGDLPRAEYAYQMALELEPDDVRVLNNLAELIAADRRRRDRRELELAETYARRAVALVPDDPGPRDTLAFAIAAAGRPGEAVDEFARAAAMLRSRLDALRATRPATEATADAATRTAAALAASLVRAAQATREARRWGDVRALLDEALRHDPAIASSADYRSLKRELR